MNSSSVEQICETANLYFAVVSRGRAYNVSDIQKIVGWDKIWFYVPIEESEDYIKAGASVKGRLYKTLAEKRNIVLEDAKRNGQNCLMMDDDLRSIKFAESKTEEKPITFAEMLNYMLYYLFFDPKYLHLQVAGIPQIAKLFYFNPRHDFSTNLFVVSNIYIIKRTCDLFFDEKLQTKSDYDFSLQNISKYGGILRCNRILAEFQHWTNKGGLTGIRNQEIAKESVDYLKKKWGTAIRDNKKRPNEILLTRGRKKGR